MTDKITRRDFFRGAAALGGSTLLSGCVGNGIPDMRGIGGLSNSGRISNPTESFSPQPAYDDPLVDPSHIVMRDIPYHGSERPGTIIVNFQGYKLYHINYDRQTATEYPIALGREGVDADYNGLYVAYKDDYPTWTPTPSMVARDPSLRPIEGGSPNNPLGTHAVYFFDRNGNDSLLRAHGTNQPHTIGTSASSGCFRMLNDHAKHLYTYVRIPDGPTDSPVGKSLLLPHRNGLLVPGMNYRYARVMTAADVTNEIREENAYAQRMSLSGGRPTF